EIGGKVGDNLRAGLAQLPLARQLTTIRCDVPLALRPTDLVRREPDIARLRELYRRLEFKSWLAELGGTNAPAARPRPPAARPEPGTSVQGQMNVASVTTTGAEYEMVLDDAALDRWIERLTQSGEFAFDTETTAIDSQRAEIVGVSFTDKAGAGAYVPLAHRYPGAP